MNQEIPLSGGDAIINAVSGQWGVASSAPSTGGGMINPLISKMIGPVITLFGSPSPPPP